MRPLTASVTALRFVTLVDSNHQAIDVLLAGIGNQVRLLRPGRERLILWRSVFGHGERVHGFSPAAHNRVIVHGGRCVAVLDIQLDANLSGGNVHVQALKEFEDWVWSSTWICQNEFIVVACGYSISWICHGESLRKQFSVRTTENELTWSTELHQEKQSSRLLAVAGTSFGDLFIWELLFNSEDVVRQASLPSSSGENNNVSEIRRPRPVHRLKGHEGAVVRIRLSHDAKSLVSASVDRTVRLWQRSKPGLCSICGPHGCFVPKLAHYGHLARVWDVAFLSNETQHIVSVSEDRTCRIWSDQLAGKEVAVYYGHDGRNVWSLDILPTGKINSWIASGGEDGEVKVRCFPITALDYDPVQANERSAETIASRECMSEVFTIPGNYSNVRKTCETRDESGRTVIIPRKGLVVLSTDFGRIMGVNFAICTDKNTSEEKKLHAAWSELYRDLKGIAYTPSSLVVCNDFLFAGKTNGVVTILKVQDNQAHGFTAQMMLDLHAFLGQETMVMGIFVGEGQQEEHLHLFVANSTGELYHWTVGNDAEGKLQTEYCRTYRQSTPTKSALVTSALYLSSLALVVVGDRGGRVLVYDDGSRDVNRVQDWESLEKIDSYPLHICRPHHDRVSSLQEILPTNFSNLTENLTGKTSALMTAGFDGRMSRIKVTRKEDPTTNTKGRYQLVNSVSLDVVSVEKTIERVDTIRKLIFPTLSEQPMSEGGQHLSINRNDSIQVYGRQCVVGFRSADVIVWDVQQRNELFRKNCGNWRRAHDIYLDVRCSVAEGNSSQLTVEGMTLAFWRAGKLYVVETRETPSRRVHHDIDRALPHFSNARYVQSIGAGFHGQRVNAVTSTGENNVFLTASEDTTVRVLSMDGGLWRTHQTLSKHISGVNDVSTVALRSGAHVAFSAGGCDEIVVWLSEVAVGPWKDVSVLQVGESSVRNGIEQSHSPLDRVLCIEAIGRASCSCKKDCVNAVAGRSDGSLVMVQSYENRDTGFRRVGREWDSKVVWLHRNAHDGAVLTASGARARAAGEDLWVIATGDTKGTVCVWVCRMELLCSEQKLCLVSKWQQVHDGGVNCVNVETDGDHVVVISGGDDEQVVVNTCTFCESESANSSSVKQGEMVWKSDIGMHTAAVTGLCVLPRSENVCRFVTVGADQRIVFGTLHLGRKRGVEAAIDDATERSVAQNAAQRSVNAATTSLDRTNVADPGGVCVSDNWLVIAGCGLEALHYDT